MGTRSPSLPTGGNWPGARAHPAAGRGAGGDHPGAGLGPVRCRRFLGVVNIQTRPGQRASTGRPPPWARPGAGPAARRRRVPGARHGKVDLMVAFRRHRADLSGLQLPRTSPAPSIPTYNLGAPRPRGLDQLSSTAIAKLMFSPPGRPEVGPFAYFSSMERGGPSSGPSTSSPTATTRAGHLLRKPRLAVAAAVRAATGKHARPACACRLRGSYFRGAPATATAWRWAATSITSGGSRFRGRRVDTHLVWTPAAAAAGGRVAASVDRERSPPASASPSSPPRGPRRRGDRVASPITRGTRPSSTPAAYLQGPGIRRTAAPGLTAGCATTGHNLYGCQLSRRVGWCPAREKTCTSSCSTARLPGPLVRSCSTPYPPPAATWSATPTCAPQYANTFEVQLAYQPWPVL